jgi:hypothetical protein
MRRALFLITLVLLSFPLKGQRSVDALFNKYAGKDGFVTITLKGNLLNLARLFDEDKDYDDVNIKTGKITAIRILAQENDDIKVVNFYDKVMKDINPENYQEFMRVKESDQDLRMLVRTEGEIFREFILIAGGKENVLIQVKGNMTKEEAGKFSRKLKKDHGLSLL